MLGESLDSAVPQGVLIVLADKNKSSRCHWPLNTWQLLDNGAESGCKMRW